VRAPHKPRALGPGATLGIAAPGFAVDGERLDEGAAWLRSAGFRVKLGESVRERRGYLAGSDAQRARDLATLLDDPEVDAILCARGGYGCQRILPLLDAAKVARARKPLLGYSDVTVLHLWQLRHAGLAAFHAPMLEHGAWSELETEAVVAEGRLVGGSLKLVATSLGTPFEIDTEGALLLLEDVGERPYAIDRMLQQLLAAGKLEGVAGVAFGGLVGCDDPKRGEPTAEQVVEEVLAPLGLPLVLGLPFGHARPNLPWPVGARAALDAERGELVVLEEGVER
jgi:muramoyltetrapeptide carboxypeptidase